MSLSARVNTIFAAYVATEAEQFRLGDLGTPEAEREANALGDKALALAVELHGIEDYSGNADLVAARALHELMLLNQWNKLGQFEWGYDSRDHLAVVFALAGATTGAVKEQVRAVMLTKGIVLPESGTDPMLDLIGQAKEHVAAYRTAPLEDMDGEDEWLAANPDPAGDKLHSDPPRPTTTAGALAAVRFVMEDGGFVQAPHAAILGRALAFLEGRASA